MNATTAVDLTIQLMLEAQKYCPNLSNSELGQFTRGVATLFDEVSKHDPNLLRHTFTSIRSMTESLNSTAVSMASLAAASGDETNTV